MQQDKSHEVNIVPTPNVSTSLSFDVRTSTLDLVVSDAVLIVWLLLPLGIIHSAPITSPAVCTL